MATSVPCWDLVSLGALQAQHFSHTTIGLRLIFLRKTSLALEYASKHENSDSMSGTDPEIGMGQSCSSAGSNEELWGLPRTRILHKTPLINAVRDALYKSSLISIWAAPGKSYLYAALVIIARFHRIFGSPELKTDSGL